MSPTVRRVVVSVSLPPKSADAIERAAKKAGLSLSRYICEAAEQAVGIVRKSSLSPAKEA